MCQLLSFQDKLNLLLDISCAAARILCHSLFEIAETLHCIVKIRNGLMKSFCRIIRKKSLEITKCKGTLVEILIIFHLVKAGRSFNKQVGSPVFSFFIYQIRGTLAVIDNIQSLTLHIPAVLLDFLLQPGGDSADIFHKANGILENLVIHFLQNKFFLSGICGKYRTVSLVNMTVSKNTNLFQFSAKIKA